MTIVNFTVQYDLYALQSDNTDIDDDADIVPLTGTVTFSPVLNDNRAALAANYFPRPSGFKLRDCVGVIDTDGQLKTTKGGTVGVRLPANDPVLELESLVYKVTFTLTTPVGEPVAVESGYFTAPNEDVIVNLAYVLEPTGGSVVSLPPTFVTLDSVASPLGVQLARAGDPSEARQIIDATSAYDVVDLLAADATVVAAAAAAVDAALIDDTVVSGAHPIVSGDYSFAITDQENRISWLAATPSGGVPSYSKIAIGQAVEEYGAVIGAVSAESSLAFSISDNTNRRSDLELDASGRLSDRVIASIKPRLGLSESIPELTASGKVYLSAPSTGSRTLLGTISGASNPTLLDATSVRVETSSGPRWVSTTVSAHRPVFPLADIACWGDSLTYGTIINGATVTQASPSYPQTLATALGVNVYNGGVAGAGSTEIACRQGGIQPQVTLTGNQIPSGSTAAITATTVTGASGWLPGKFVHGTLAGTAGTLTLSLSGSTWTFTPDSAPAANVSVAAGTKFFGDEGVNLRDRINIIWAGTNNYTDPTTVLRDVEAMVNWLTPYAKRYLVIGLTRAGRSATDLLKYPLQAAYGGRFVDLRGYLISSGLAAAGISATATDTADIAAGNVPTSLLSDGLHFTQTGYTVIGQYLASIITSKNWI